MNDGCTRGCRLERGLDRNQYPLARKCEDSKPTRKSSKNCTRHITGAIMTVIHYFLADHCKYIGHEIPIDYQQCVDNFTWDIQNNNTNICRHGLIFYSALCMLNLDKKDVSIYNDILDKDVRLICKRWDQYNQSLLAVNTSPYGETTAIPLFKKISPNKNKEFQKDPSKIPEGAIIVTRSRRKHGHVEVKTDRNECGKNKIQTCFCSDHCRERLRYNYPVLAVFEWNPEFIKYVSTIL